MHFFRRFHWAVQQPSANDLKGQLATMATATFCNIIEFCGLPSLPSLHELPCELGWTRECRGPESLPSALSARTPESAAHFGVGRRMSSHRRSGALKRMLSLRRPPNEAIPAPYRQSIELVDARTLLAHRVTPEELGAGRTCGDYQALCGARLLAASLTDPGHGRCRQCNP